MPKSFTIRVYGICFNPDGALLVADEIVKGMQITKFPGGGLEFGEGTRDCLKREFLEETGQDIEITEHFYTTDFFIASVFDPKKQVISIYYKVRFVDEPKFSTRNKKFDFPEKKDDVFVFRWLPVTDIRPDEFTFPIDKKVAELLAKR